MRFPAPASQDHPRTRLHFDSVRRQQLHHHFEGVGVAHFEQRLTRRNRAFAFADHANDTAAGRRDDGNPFARP